MNKTSILATIALASSIACNAAPSDAGGVTDTAEVVAQSCTSKVDAEVLERAHELNEEAHITGRVMLYENEHPGDFPDAVLVRVSDETEPSDYVVFRNASDCIVEDVLMVASGMVPPDGSLVPASRSPSCAGKVREAVLEQAKEINDTAHVTGMKLLYGGTTWANGVALVRVSDEVEPSDYVAVYELDPERAGDQCKVVLVKAVSSGILPDVEGLEASTSCVGPDDRPLAEGDSFTTDCNACTCTDRGIVCTELVCP